jgi:hypothetical protein
MNAFVQHHRELIDFQYSCFDRILCYAGIQPFQWSSGHVSSFLRQRRQIQTVTPRTLRNISSDYHLWLTEQAAQTGVPIVEPPPDVRRDEWVQPYYQDLGAHHGTAVILKCRERARVAVSLPSRGHFVELAWRYINLYYFYQNDPHCGRMWLRLCPYFPFNGQICVNGHHWLARQMDSEGIAYQQQDNAFVACAAPARLQELADAFGPDDLLQTLHRGLDQWLTFFTPAEKQQGFRHHLYVSQVEYCHNLIFHQKAALRRLFDRLLDHNRSLGRPDKLALIFGRRHFRPDTRTGETRITITPTRTPVINCRFQNTSLKQYVRGYVLMRTEAASYQVKDLALRKNVQELPKMRQVLAASTERYLEVQQDVLVSFIDRGQLEQLRQPSVSPTGRRTPGLHGDDRRLIAVLQALLSFAHLVGQGCFRTAALLGAVQHALDRPDYRLSQLRYDLGKLRGKGWVQRLPRTLRYQVTPQGYQGAILYCKLYQRLYAPLLSAILDPFDADTEVSTRYRVKLDRLYAAVGTALDQLTEHLGIAA